MPDKGPGGADEKDWEEFRTAIINLFCFYSPMLFSFFLLFFFFLALHVTSVGRKCLAAHSIWSPLWKPPALDRWSLQCYWVSCLKQSSQQHNSVDLLVRLWLWPSTGAGLLSQQQFPALGRFFSLGTLIPCTNLNSGLYSAQFTNSPGIIS